MRRQSRLTDCVGDTGDEVRCDLRESMLRDTAVFAQLRPEGDQLAVLERLGLAAEEGGEVEGDAGGENVACEEGVACGVEAVVLMS